MIQTGVYSVPGSPGHGITLFRHGSDGIAGAWYCHDLQGLPFWFLLGAPRWTAANTVEFDALASPGVPSGDPFGYVTDVMNVIGSVRLSTQAGMLLATYRLERAALHPPELEFSPPPPPFIEGGMRLQQLL